MCRRYMYICIYMTADNVQQSTFRKFKTGVLEPLEDKNQLLKNTQTKVIVLAYSLTNIWGTFFYIQLQY